jgi:hypothetical protein
MFASIDELSGIHGWTTQTVDSREEATRLGRPPTSDDARFRNKFVVAGKDG